MHKLHLFLVYTLNISFPPRKREKLYRWITENSVLKPGIRQESAYPVPRVTPATHKIYKQKILFLDTEPLSLLHIIKLHNTFPSNLMGLPVYASLVHL